MASAPFRAFVSYDGGVHDDLYMFSDIRGMVNEFQHGFLDVQTVHMDFLDPFYK